MNRIFTTIILLLAICMANAAPKTYFVATNGSDSNDGSKAKPFATFGKAYKTMAGGDTVYFRGGTYHITEKEIMTKASPCDVSHPCYVFDITKGGKKKARSVFAGYPGERPVFDFSDVKPKCRIMAFTLNGDCIHLKNFDVIGVQATCHGHYLSVAVYAVNTSNSITENIAMHDSKAIGYYAIHGHDNLVLNCDAYNNFDDYAAFKTDEAYQLYLQTGQVPKGSVSETLGGNADGYGFHACCTTDTGNKFIGCRAWWNSDDGFDCINSHAAVVWDHCWAFYNGYEPNSARPRGDGNGFKAGGYGMGANCKGFPDDDKDRVPDFIPRNIISNCIAYENKTNGFYANHHLGGCDWINDIAIYNGLSTSTANYNMTNRDYNSLTIKGINVPGYGHKLQNCISYLPNNGRHLKMIGPKCKIENCDTIDTDSPDFVDVKRTKVGTLIPLMNQRQPDGKLPQIKNFYIKYNETY